MIGSNLEATRFSGVTTRRVQIWVYLISSVLRWLAAIIMIARFYSAGGDIGQSHLLVTASRRFWDVPILMGNLACRRFICRALESSSRRERLQSYECQSSSGARFLGTDPLAGHGGQPFCGDVPPFAAITRSGSEAVSALPLDHSLRRVFDARADPRCSCSLCYDRRTRERAWKWPSV
jgi:hypothetical protein